MLEYEFYNGENFVIFNIIGLNTDNNVATMAITCAGKISVQDIDLKEDENGLYFEYGPIFDIIHIDDFELR